MASAHERGVERAADVERRDPLHAELLGAGRAGGDAVGRAGDHDLAGCVVVGDPAGVGRRGARVLGLLGGRAEQRGHPAGMGVGGGLGELGATGREAHAGVERERAGRDQRGDLAERVAGERDRSVGEAAASASHATSEVRSTASCASRVRASASAGASVTR